jgi:Recombination endonuclease VII
MLNQKQKEYQKQYYQNNKEHICQKTRDWRKNNPDKAKNGDLLKTSGRTLEDYMWKAQEQLGVCAICGKPETKVHPRTGKVQMMASDHNHKTGQLRGLLCQQCNTAIGSLMIDEQGIELLLSAISYVRKYGG